jgi:hypothetical protein
VIRTTQVELLRVDEVSAESAAARREGDGSIKFGRRAHEAFVGRAHVRIGRCRRASRRQRTHDPLRRRWHLPDRAVPP